MEKIIISDCDGCLVNWNHAFEAFMFSKGYNRIPGTEHEYNLSSRFGISSKEAFSRVTEFNESEVISNLEPLSDSVEYVKKLANLGFEFIIVTSISESPRAKLHRTLNLTNLFGNIFKEIVCLKSGSNKYNELARWQDSKYFWIEDHMRQAEAGHEVGLRPILVDQPYNKHYQTDLFPRVSLETPWEEIYNIVCRDYNIS